jgi:antirestriction protein ArdC
MSTTQAPNRRASHQAAREALKQAVSQLLNEDAFRRWVTIRAKFHRYSFGNCLLIAAQRPNATMVAGYQTWKRDFSRNVRRGEKAIRILAPITVTCTDRETDERTRTVIGFRSVCVFDIAQTDGQPLPEPPTCLHDQGDELANHRPALENHARELGYTVTYRPLDGPLGYCDPDTQTIVIADRLAPNSQVATLVHELAHAHGLGYRDYGRAHCEVIVEATTAIRARHAWFRRQRLLCPVHRGLGRRRRGP